MGSGHQLFVSAEDTRTRTFDFPLRIDRNLGQGLRCLTDSAEHQIFLSISVSDSSEETFPNVCTVNHSHWMVGFAISFLHK